MRAIVFKAKKQETFPSSLLLICLNSKTLKKCDSAAIRTQDPRLRRALLYPAELRNQPYAIHLDIACKDTFFFMNIQTIITKNYIAILFTFFPSCQALMLETAISIKR